jgi:hypothetical protein
MHSDNRKHHFQHADPVLARSHSLWALVCVPRLSTRGPISPMTRPIIVITTSISTSVKPCSPSRPAAGRGVVSRLRNAPNIKWLPNRFILLRLISPRHLRHRKLRSDRQDDWGRTDCHHREKIRPCLPPDRDGTLTLTRYSRVTSLKFGFGMNSPIILPSSLTFQAPETACAGT